MTITEFKRRVFNKMFMTYGEEHSDAKEYGYDEKVIPMLNECLTLIANSTYPDRKSFDVILSENSPLTFKLPREVLSVLYVDTCVESATFFMLNSRTVKFNKPGKYTLICDCLYSDIPEADDEEINSIMEDIPESVLTIAVLYVVSQLMYDTDQIRAGQIRNEFELELARLDTDRQDIQEHFTMSSRW